MKGGGVGSPPPSLGLWARPLPATLRAATRAITVPDSTLVVPWPRRSDPLESTFDRCTCPPLRRGQRRILARTLRIRDPVAPHAHAAATMDAPEVRVNNQWPQVTVLAT